MALSPGIINKYNFIDFNFLIRIIENNTKDELSLIGDIASVACDFFVVDIIHNY